MKRWKEHSVIPITEESVEEPIRLFSWNFSLSADKMKLLGWTNLVPHCQYCKMTHISWSTPNKVFWEGSTVKWTNSNLIITPVVSWLTLVEADKLREFTDILARTEIRFTHTGTIAVPVLVEVVQFGAVHLQEYPTIIEATLKG